jgi:hypothetical protein
LATGYVRQSAADIVSGEVVRAAPLNNEFNAIRDAMAVGTGHNHDGTTGGGAFITTLADSDGNNKIVIDTGNNRVGVFVEVSAAPVEQVRFADGSFVPVTTNDVDIGSTSARFKAGWFAGAVTADSVAATSATLTNLAVTNVTGTVTFDNVVVNGTVDFTNAVLANVATPVALTDGANKGYVDTAIAAAVSGTFVNMPVEIVTGTSVTAQSQRHYILRNASLTTVTCPSTLAGEFMVTVENGRADNVIARNGNNIMGLAEDITLSTPGITWTVKAIDATTGWRIY